MQDHPAHRASQATPKPSRHITSFEHHSRVIAAMYQRRTIMQPATSWLSFPYTESLNDLSVRSEEAPSGTKVRDS